MNQTSPSRLPIIQDRLTPKEGSGKDLGEITILAADYFGEFNCIGPDCEDSCCKDWGVISVDDQTRAQYQNIPNGELRTEIEQRIVSSHDGKYKIDLGKDSVCPFWGSDRLCSIQKRLGGELLPSTCETYPRITNHLLGVYERSLILSCPEAARKVLLRPQGIKLVAFDSPRWREISASERTGEIFFEGPARDAEEVALRRLEMRDLALKLLQDRSRPVEQRLLLLGKACKKFTYALEVGSVTLLKRALAEVSRYEDQPTPNRKTPTLEACSVAQSEMIASFIVNPYYQERVLWRYKNICHEIKEFLQFNSQQPLGPKEIYQLYKQSSSNLLLPFQQEHGYIFENYLVNEFIRTFFPANNSLTPYDAYAVLAIRYALFRAHLLLLSGARGEITCESAVEVAQAMAKSYDHSRPPWESLVQNLRVNNQLSLNYLALLTGPSASENQSTSSRSEKSTRGSDL